MDIKWLFKNGTTVDPVSGMAHKQDLYVENGFINRVPERIPEDTSVVEAEGLTIVPGMIDMHVHFREPGDAAAESIESGSRAAARGGFTTVVTMPNTTPPVDSPADIAWHISRAEAAGLVRLKPAGCVSSERRGFDPAPLAQMADAGAVAFSDDGATVANPGLLRLAMRTCSDLDKPILDHPLDSTMAGDGVMHRGSVSRNLGLPGIPSSAETTIVERNIRLSSETGCRVHLQHLSAGRSTQLLEEAQRKGLRISGEVTPHHLCLTDSDVDGRDSNYKMNPPLRTENDRRQLVSALRQNVIQALATDHAPHSSSRKMLGFESAPFGVIGMETAVGTTYSLLVLSGTLSLVDWVRRWTTGPAEILGLEAPSLTDGAVADITVLDLQTEYEIDPSKFLSSSRNTPFAGRRVVGRSALTMTGGRLTWNDGTLSIHKAGGS